MNSISLIGRLTRNVELKYTPSGHSVGRFTLAVNRRVAKDNEQQADFISCIAWNKTAEIIAKYVHKGHLIGLQGRIQTGSYENQQGQRVYTTDVIVENFDFLERKKDNTTNQDTPQYQSSQQTEDMQQGEFDLFNISDNDLPF